MDTAEICVNIIKMVNLYFSEAAAMYTKVHFTAAEALKFREFQGTMAVWMAKAARFGKVYVSKFSPTQWRGGE